MLISGNSVFKHILIDPALAKANRIKIISGFATANMVDRHMDHLHRQDVAIDIDLIVGMTPRSGIELTHHKGFQNFQENPPYSEDMGFQCSYIAGTNPIHAKVYCWLKDDKPVAAWLGSANYTMTGFGRSQIECMSATNAGYASYFFDFIKKRNAVGCLDGNVEDLVAFKRSHDEELRTSKLPQQSGNEDSVSLSFLVRGGGGVGDKSGLNWGQRGSRDRNEAYIPVPAKVYQSCFFPDRTIQFTVLTDDGCSMIMVRAQDSGKALHSVPDNSQMGRYFRKRMKLPSGQYVTEKDLLKYGRTDVSFTKIDDETYFMDFSPNLDPCDDADIWENSPLG